MRKSLGKRMWGEERIVYGTITDVVRRPPYYTMIGVVLTQDYFLIRGNDGVIYWNFITENAKEGRPGSRVKFKSYFQAETGEESRATMVELLEGDGR